MLMQVFCCFILHASSFMDPFTGQKSLLLRILLCSTPSYCLIRKYEALNQTEDISKCFYSFVPGESFIQTWIAILLTAALSLNETPHTLLVFIFGINSKVAASLSVTPCLTKGICCNFVNYSFSYLWLLEIPSN